MYSFSHNIDNTQRYNTYQYYHEETPKKSFSSFAIKLFLILIVISATLMTGLYIYSRYIQQSTTYASHETRASNLQPILTQAITKSITKNIQSKQLKQPLNDEQLKHIIKRVVKKIEEKSTNTIYKEG